ncbi:hypothetical protein K439DRAFT_1350553 [Ramaria rubella]|nr:hypothetical protein K439DRAFT_1350553 [Ramaria rubella]
MSLSDLREQHYQPNPLLCLWGGCGLSFDAYQDLITHVNTAHLQLTPQYASQSQQISTHHQLTSSDDNVAAQNFATLSCLWDNCSRYPSPSQIPGPSTGNVTDAAKGLLACHVRQDHLGLPVVHQTTHTEPSLLLHGEDPSRDVPSHHPHPHPTCAVAAPSDFPDQGVCSSASALTTSQCFCKWDSCELAGVPFGSAAELTNHITDVHVGVGSSRYHCLWEGCNRSGGLGFSSKQKILRHVQSHTGHRPFRCTTCDQYFSEAATLQQHMRRHTKEKPYICDFPGCGKAFAITGALTIHRRVHSGSKPFRCTFCNRQVSFSESSNLSKHVRTHTGDRPYACTFPGCDKRFARPDQVARHKNVHTKKKGDLVKNLLEREMTVSFT